MKLIDFTTIINDKTKNEIEKKDAFDKLFAYYRDLVKKVLNKKKYSHRQLSVDIFRKEWTEKQSETVFKKSLFASFKTLERIKNSIETGVVNNFKIGKNGSINDFVDFLNTFTYDVFEIVKYAELNYNGKTLNYSMGSSLSSSSREIYENSSIILFVKHFGTNSIHYRDFFSYSVFSIRLMIEVAGKKILGYSSITDEKGKRVEKIKTQIAWEFIKIDQNSTKRIELPVEVDTILKIEKWSNQFIHTGYIQPIYQIENALVFLEKLANPKPSKIKDYDTLKIEFKDFLKTKVKEEQEIVINWINKIEWNQK